MSAFILSDIFIYPVKSLAGIRVSQWDVVETGFRYDRQWMLIDEEGKFLSQRTLPKMALIQTRLTDTDLILSMPSHSDLSVPLHPQEGAIIKSTVWDDCCDAQHVSNEADDWFSKVLDAPCRLVYLPTETKRGVDLTVATEIDHVAFSDAFPFLLVSENSLNALNAALDMPVEMARFRPNLVISGCDAYAEDTWREIQIGEISFRLPKPCDRCGIPALNPQTAELTKEPLTTLSKLRKWENKIYFGQNALHNQHGELKIGDSVKVNEIGDKQPPIL